jgi:hypothetical protein
MTDKSSIGPEPGFGIPDDAQAAMAKFFFPNHPSEAQIAEFFHVLGRAITFWQLVETALYQVYERAISPTRPGACAASFHALQAFNVKLSATDAAVRFCLAENSDLLDEWDKLKEHAQKKSGRRNEFVHFSTYIMRDEENENEKIVLEPQIFDSRPNKTRHRLPDIKEISNRFIELANKLERFVEKIPITKEQSAACPPEK